MFDLDGIWNSDKKIKIVTGLTLAEAEYLLEDFEEELKKIRRKNAKSVVGRPAKLDSKSIFLMLMIFFRHYNTFEFIAVLFDVDVSTIKRWVDDAHLALGNLLVKKNFRHLIALNQDKMSKTGLSNSEKSILMALNNL